MNEQSKFETLLLNARLLTSHKKSWIIWNWAQMKLNLAFTCKLHCMHVVVDRVVCVSGARVARGPRDPAARRPTPAPARTRRLRHARSVTRHAAAARPRTRPCDRLRRTAPTHPHTPILSPTIYYFDLYFMYRARTPGGKRFICWVTRAVRVKLTHG